MDSTRLDHCLISPDTDVVILRLKMVVITQSIIVEGFNLSIESWPFLKKYIFVDYKSFCSVQAIALSYENNMVALIKLLTCVILKTALRRQHQ